MINFCYFPVELLFSHWFVGVILGTSDFEKENTLKVINYPRKTVQNSEEMPQGASAPTLHLY